MKLRTKAAVLLLLSFLLAATDSGFEIRQINASQSVINLSDIWEPNTGNGNNDDTAVFKQGLQLAQGGTLYIPKSSVAYSISNLFIPANTHIVFESGTVVQANAGLPINLPLINISAANNVTIDGNGVTFNMDKSQYLDGYTGEGTHVFSIQYASTNIALNNINVTSSGGGDGFYINNAYNVTVSGCTASGCKRDGLTIISGNGVLVENSSFSNKNGCGVDIEPNVPENFLKNIVFNQVLCENNNGSGVSLSLYNYRNAINPIDISITFNNVTTRNNSHGVGLYIENYVNSILVTGIINVNNYTSDGDKEGLEIINNKIIGPSVNVNKWTIVNPTAYYLSIVNYKDVFVRDMVGVTFRRIVFTQEDS